MNRKRIIAIAKLVLLFGTPVALILGLFSCGVYCGVQNRTGIARFERDWLGFDVEVPSETKTEGGGSEEPASTEPKPSVEPKPSEAEGVEPQPAQPTPQPAQPTPQPTQPTPQPAQPTPQPTQPAVVPGEQPGVAGVPAPLPEPETRVDPLDDAGSARLGIPVTVKVGVLVDSQFIASNRQWIDTVQRTVSRASDIYEDQFGVTLELWAVGRWPVAEQGVGPSELLDDLRGRSRDGADVLLGFTSRAFVGTAADKPTPPSAEDPFNGAYGVVYGSSGHRQSHLRPLLHELSLLMGAQDVADPEDPAWIAGSWMSYAPVSEAQAPWIDVDNRLRVLARKDKPFAPVAPAPKAQ